MLATARIAAGAYARRALADNARRPYCAGVRAWCERDALPCLAGPGCRRGRLPRRRGFSVTTFELGRAAIHYLHFICGCAVPIAETKVSETMAGMHRIAAAPGRLSAQKLPPSDTERAAWG